MWFWYQPEYVAANLCLFVLSIHPAMMGDLSVGRIQDVSKRGDKGILIKQEIMQIKKTLCSQAKNQHSKEKHSFP